jgi:hypothetical protein
MSLSIEKEILRLNIPVSNALSVKIGQASEDLLEATFNLTGGHPSALDRCIKITSRTVFHHFTPVLIFVLHEVDSLDDVCMV